MSIHAAAPVDRQGARRGEVVEPLHEAFRDVRERLRARGSGGSLDDGRAGVAPLADGDLDGDLPEQRRVGEVRHLLPAARAEDVVALVAAVADETALVLDHAEQRDADLLRPSRRDL